MHPKINEKGQALVMVLFCSVIALLFVIAVLFMVSRGEQSSGMEKRYATALDATDAGVSVSVKFIDEKTIDIASSASNAFQTGVTLTDPLPACLNEKLNLPTSLWSTCSAAQMNLDPEDNPDITFTIRGTDSNALYDVKAKIVDSQRGVTGSPPGKLQMGGVVNSDGVLTPVNLPYFYYTVEVSAKMQVPSNAKDRNAEQAHLTYIYAD